MALRRSMLVVFVGLVAATWSVGAQGNKVSGTLTVGPTKVALANGMAIGYKAPNGQLTSVVLSDNAVDAKSFAEDTKTGPGEPLVSGTFEGAWKSQHFGKKLSGVTFTLNDKGIMTEEILVGGRNNTFSMGDSEYVLDVKSRSPRLVGSIKTKAPVDLGGGRKVALDASFDIAVTTR